MKEKCTLSNEELVEKANELVHKLSKTGGKSWTLSVPVDFNNDPDMIFIELGQRLLEQIAKYKSLQNAVNDINLLYKDRISMN